MAGKVCERKESQASLGILGAVGGFEGRAWLAHGKTFAWLCSCSSALRSEG